MPFILDTNAPPTKLTEEVKANIDGVQKGGSTGADAALVFARFGLHMVENIFVGAANIVAAGLGKQPIVGQMDAWAQQNYAENSAFAEARADAMAQRFENTGYSMSYMADPLPAAPAIPLAIAPPDWADQQQLAQNALLIGTGALVLTMAVSAYLSRKRQPDGKVVVEDKVVELTKQGIEAAARGDEAGLLAAQKEIDGHGNTPIQEEIVQRLEANRRQPSSTQSIEKTRGGTYRKRRNRKTLNRKTRRGF
jgi:hypothetical protein